MELKTREVNLILEAIELGNDMAIGRIEVQNIGIETVVWLNKDFLKCFPSSKAFLATNNSLFQSLEDGLVELGYEKISILENGTKVKIKSCGTEGTIGGNDLEDSEDDLSNLNYYVIPTGKSFDDEIMTHKDDIEIL